MKLGNCLLVFTFLTSCTSLFAQTNSAYLNYIDRYKDLAIEQMHLYNIPASITLAQGLFESNAGQSSLSIRSNNHFGIKCGTGWNGRTTRHTDDAPNECFRVYPSVRASYEDHSLFLKNKTRYAFLFQLHRNDYKGWAIGLKKAGYATDPQYANRLINLIEKYHLYEYDDHKRVSATEKKLESVARMGDGSREVRLINGVLAVQVRAGESWNTLSREYRKKVGKLMKYNDVPKDYRLKEGEWIYLQKKKRHASHEYFRQRYVVKAGDSMYSISQQFGIRLKSLYKMNKMKATSDMPKVGTPVRIR